MSRRPRVQAAVLVTSRSNNNDKTDGMYLSMETSDLNPAPAWSATPVPSLSPPKQLVNPRLRQLTLQFLRYVLVGGLAFVVDYAVLSGLLHLDAHYMLATLAGFLAGLVVNYLLCVFWVWRGTQAKTPKDILIFTLIGIGGLLLTALLMWVSVDLLAVDPQLAKLFIAALVLFWNFGLRRIFVFFR